MLRRPAKPRFSFRKLRLSPLLAGFVHKLNATVKASRTLMLAAIFSSSGNGTRLDRVIPVSTALLKRKAARRYACMHPGTCVDRRS